MPSADSWVVDASVLVDLVIGGAAATASAATLSGHQLHAPAHVDVEVASALARLHRAGAISRAAAGRAVSAFADAPLVRHELPMLLPGAWRRQTRLRVADAFYVELAHRLGTRVLTVDARLARTTTYAVLPEGVGG